MINTIVAPWWGDYLARERTMCSLCHREGRGWVRIGDPIPPNFQRRGVRQGWKSRQRAAFRRHVAELHPDLRVRWAR